MSTEHVLRMTGKQHALLKKHLYPGDNLEAVALAICGHRRGTSRHCLSVWKVIPVSYDLCNRYEDRVTWSTDPLVDVLVEAERRGMAVVKFHSHPSGYEKFSTFDDIADSEFFEAASAWTGNGCCHGSVVMLPDGSLFGRVIAPDGSSSPVDQLSVAGDTIEYFFSAEGSLKDFSARHAQAFGEGTSRVLSKLHIGVVGCSGTGSPTVEQLFRLGVKRIVPVDPERVEIVNLNRIINSSRVDAMNGTAKVEVMKRAIMASRLGTECVPIQADLVSPEVIRAIAECDVIFGCVDSIYARHVLNKTASAYNIPYFDVGVRLIADGRGGVEHVTGAVHYLQPDGSSLLSRGLYTLDDLKAESMRATDPQEYSQLRGEGYIANASVSRPAVIPVNMVFSGLAVFELLCRIHDVRGLDTPQYAGQRVSLVDFHNYHAEDGERCMTVTRNAGRGDIEPLLDMPELSTPTEEAQWPVYGNI